MTEDEAKTKWCPQTLHATLRVTEYVQWPVEMSGALCIGSACMAWRWLPRYGENPNNPAEAMSLPPTEGFCGLAGRPHA